MNQLTVSLWGDEAFASILAQKSLIDIVTIVARDTSPPLHYIFLHFWMNLFGTNEIAIRTFPMLLFVLLSYVVYRFTKDVFGEKAAMWAFFLTLLNPFLFIYAFEARMYMLLALTSTASMWFFVTKRWKCYIVATAAALYTHHFSMFVVIVQVIHYVLTNKLPRSLLRGIPSGKFASRFHPRDESRGISARNKEDLKKNLSKPLHLIKKHWNNPFIRSLLAVILIYAPWLPALYGQTTQVAGDFWLSKPHLDDLWKLFSHFIAGSTNLQIGPLALLLGIFLLFMRGYKKEHDRIMYLWLLFPAFATFLLSYIGRPLFFDRYLIISTAAIPILLSSQRMSNVPSKKIGTVLLSIVAIGLVFVNLYSFQHPIKQPFRDVAQYVYDMYGKDKMVINYYTDALHYFELKHYRVNVKIYSPQGPLPFWVGTALIDPDDVLKTLPADRTLLIMASGDTNRVALPGYTEIRRQQFRDLYLLWLMKTGK